MKYQKSLVALVNAAIHECSNSTDIAISPSTVARLCSEMVDPDNIAPIQKTIGFELEIRQIARNQLRRMHDPSVRVMRMRDDQLALFEKNLQERYPARRHNEDVYVLRAYLTVGEREKICKRLEKESHAKAKHAEALRAETELLQSQGYFQVPLRA